MDQPGKPGAGADLHEPANARYCCGVCRQQPAHFDVAGELETSSGGSFVRSQNAAGSSSPSVTRGKNAEHRGAGSMFLPMARPIRRSSQLSGRVALVRARLGHLQAPPSRLDSGPAASMRCGQVARGNPVTRGCGGAQGNRADLQAQLWHDPGKTRRILVVDGLQPLESCGRRLLTPCGEARTSWRGPRARTISWPCFRAARPSLRGVSGLLSSALYVRRFRAAVVTGASAAARFLWAVL